MSNVFDIVLAVSRRRGWWSANGGGQPPQGDESETSLSPLRSVKGGRPYFLGDAGGQPEIPSLPSNRCENSRSDYAQNYAHPLHRHAVTFCDGWRHDRFQVLEPEHAVEIRLNAYAYG